MEANPLSFAELLQGFFTNGWALSSLLAVVIVIQWRRAVKLQDKADDAAAGYLAELLERRTPNNDDDN